MYMYMYRIIHTAMCVCVQYYITTFAELLMTNTILQHYLVIDDTGQEGRQIAVGTNKNQGCLTRFLILGVPFGECHSNPGQQSPGAIQIVVPGGCRGTTKESRAELSSHTHLENFWRSGGKT